MASQIPIRYCWSGLKIFLLVTLYSAGYYSEGSFRSIFLSLHRFFRLTRAASCPNRGSFQERKKITDNESRACNWQPYHCSGPFRVCFTILLILLLTPVLTAVLKHCIATTLYETSQTMCCPIIALSQNLQIRCQYSKTGAFMKLMLSYIHSDVFEW